jgi:hypothetical protein
MAGIGPVLATAPLPSLPFTAYPKKGKHLLFVLVSAVFVAIGVFMIQHGEGMGWFCFGVFGLMLLAFLANLLPGSSYLTVSELGIEYSALFRKHRLQWSEIAEIGVYTIRQHGVPVGTMVGFNYSPHATNPSRARALSKAVSGFEGGLPDTYGFKAEELAAMLAACHQRFVYQSGRR